MGLWKHLSAFGWRVSITLGEDTRRPDKAIAPRRWVCQVDHLGYDGGGSRIGSTAWECLRRAVKDLVIPAEAKTGAWLGGG